MEEIAFRSRLQKLAPYWYIIGLLLVAGASLFVYHLTTGFTPDEIAFQLPVFQFNVYWYGVIITAGIILGAYVVAQLAEERAGRVFARQVPAQVRAEPVGNLELPEEIAHILARHDVVTVGDLLLPLAFGPEYVGLNRSGGEVVRRQLMAHKTVDRAWVEAPSWRHWKPDHVWNGLIWCLILALIGARLYHVFVPSPSNIYSTGDYLRNPLQLINLRRGGLGIYGGIAGGALGLFLYSYRHRVPTLAWADLAVVGVALGQSVGRWGNFFNQELYGRPTNLPWAIEINNPLPGFEAFETFHPAFLYASLWNLLVFVVLLALLHRYRRRLLTGDLMATYLILQAIGRVLLETVRLDSRTLVIGSVDTGLAVATALSLAIAIVMAGWLFWRHRRA